MSGLIRNYPTLGWLFFIVTLSLAGIPPFSGLIVKVLVGQGTVETGAYLLLALAFISSIIVLYSLISFFMNCFFIETIIKNVDEKLMKISWLLPSAILAIATFALGLGAESISAYVSDAADTLMNPEIYIQAVLPEK